MIGGLLAAAVLAFAGVIAGVGSALSNQEQTRQTIRMLATIKDLRSSLDRFQTSEGRTAEGWSQDMIRARQQVRRIDSCEVATRAIRTAVIRIEAVLLEADRRRQSPGTETARRVDPDRLAQAIGHGASAEAAAQELMDDLLVAHYQRLAIARGIAGVGFVLALAAAVGLVGRYRGQVRAGQTEQESRLLAAVARSTEEGLLITEAKVGRGDPRIVFVNRSLCRMIGQPAEEVLGEPIAILNRGLLGDSGLACRAHGVGEKSATMEASIRRSDGTPACFEWHISPVMNQHGKLTHYVSSLRDVSERAEHQQALEQHAEALREANQKLRENQDQLIQAVKLAALGTISAGVAHEVNNPVAYASSNLETLTGDLEILKVRLDKMLRLAAAVLAGDHEEAGTVAREVTGLGDQDEVRRLFRDMDLCLADARDGLARVREIGHDLKEFARPDDGVCEEVNLNQEIEDSLKIAHSTLKNRCRVNLRLGELPAIRCRPRQLSQVFTNLLVNAAQAITTRQGEITIATRAEDSVVEVEISDTGTGIPEPDLAKLFKPFFTTKPPGQGTGLGLAVSYGIIKRHRGTIAVKSNLGQGTTFTIRLPRPA